MNPRDDSSTSSQYLAATVNYNNALLDSGSSWGPLHHHQQQLMLQEGPTPHTQTTAMGSKVAAALAATPVTAAAAAAATPVTVTGAAAAAVAAEYGSTSAVNEVLGAVAESVHIPWVLEILGLIVVNILALRLVLQLLRRFQESRSFGFRV
jgi:K+-transporting ATPase c subunit